MNLDYSSMIRTRLDVAYLINNSPLPDYEKRDQISHLLTEIITLCRKEIEPLIWNSQNK